MRKWTMGTALVALAASPAWAQDHSASAEHEVEYDIAANAAAPRAAAAYIKIGDIKGESQRTGDTGGTMAHDEWHEARGVRWTTVGEMMAKGMMVMDEGDGSRAAAGNIRVNRIDMALRERGGPATGRATGRRQHGTVSVRKELDKSTPMLARGLAHSDDVRIYIQRAAIDQSTPILAMSANMDRCSPGMALDTIDVREGETISRVGEATIIACRDIRTELTNNKPARGDAACSGACDVWMTYGFRQEMGQVQTDARAMSEGGGTDLLERKRPGRNPR